jgi:hypothetical protein
MNWTRAMGNAAGDRPSGCALQIDGRRRDFETARSERKTACSAEGAKSYQPGAAPQVACQKMRSAESAIQPLSHDSRFQRLRFGPGFNPGALPQARFEFAPLALISRKLCLGIG